MTAGAGRLARAASAVACERCGGTGIEPPIDDDARATDAGEILRERLLRLRPEAVARTLGIDEGDRHNAPPAPDSR